MLKHHIAKCYVSNIMRRATSHIASVICASEEILLCLKSVGSTIVKLRFAIGTEHLAGEQTHFARSGRSALTLTNFLNCFEQFLAYNRRVCVLENQLLLGRILNTLFALVVLGCSFEIDRVTKIFHSFQDTCDGFLIPIERVALIKFSVTLCIICRGDQYFLRSQAFGDLERTEAVSTKIKYLSNNDGSRLINQPFVFIFFVFDIAKWWICCQMLSAFALHLKGRLDLLCRISRVELVAEVADRCHVELGLHSRIDVIVYGNKSNVVFGKHDVGIHSDLQIVSAETGHILDDDRSDLAVFNHFLHFTKSRAVKGCSRISVVHKES